MCNPVRYQTVDESPYKVLHQELNRGGSTARALRFPVCVKTKVKVKLSAEFARISGAGICVCGPEQMGASSRIMEF